MAQSVGSPPLVVMRYLVAPHRSYFAGMAQSVEHVIGNDEVISSILITSSKAPTQMRRCFCVYMFLYSAPCLLAEVFSFLKKHSQKRQSRAYEKQNADIESVAFKRYIAQRRGGRADGHGKNFKQNKTYNCA